MVAVAGCTMMVGDGWKSYRRSQLLLGKYIVDGRCPQDLSFLQRTRTHLQNLADVSRSKKKHF